MSGLLCGALAPHGCTTPGLRCYCILDHDHDGAHMCDRGWTWAEAFTDGGP